MKLHIGCGKRILVGWENLDLKRSPKGVPPFNCIKPWRFESRSVNAVYSEALFEHLTQYEQFKYLAECRRVLRPGGVCRIAVPDGRWSLEHLITIGDVKKLGMKALDGTRDYYDSEHKFLPTESYLKSVMNSFGFSVFVMRMNESIIPDFPGDSRPLDGAVRPVEGWLYVDGVV